jgi:hypothetical protein
MFVVCSKHEASGYLLKVYLRWMENFQKRKTLEIESWAKLNFPIRSWRRKIMFTTIWNMSFILFFRLSSAAISRQQWLRCVGNWRSDPTAFTPKSHQFLVSMKSRKWAMIVFIEQRRLPFCGASAKFILILAYTLSFSYTQPANKKAMYSHLE